MLQCQWHWMWSVLLVLAMFGAGAVGKYCMVTRGSSFLSMTKELDEIQLTSCNQYCFECFDPKPGLHAIYRGICSDRYPGYTLGRNWVCRHALNPCSSTSDKTCYPLLRQIRDWNRCPQFYEKDGAIKVPDGAQVYCKDECAIVSVQNSIHGNQVAKGCASLLRNAVMDTLTEWTTVVEFNICRAQDSSCSLGESTTGVLDFLVGIRLLSDIAAVGTEIYSTYCMVTPGNMHLYRTGDLNKFNLKYCDQYCFECFDSKVGTHAVYRGVCSSRDPSSSLGSPWTCRTGLNPCRTTTETGCYPLLQQIRSWKKCQYSVSDNGTVQIPDGTEVYCKDDCASVSALDSKNVKYVAKGCAASLRKTMTTHLIDVAAELDFKICQSAESCKISESSPKVPDSVISTISISSTKAPDSSTNIISSSSTGTAVDPYVTFCMATPRYLYMTVNLDTLQPTNCVSKLCFECFDSSVGIPAVYRGVCSSSDPSSSLGSQWTCKPGLNPCQKPTDTACYPLLQQIRTWKKCQYSHSNNSYAYKGNDKGPTQIPNGIDVYCKEECAAVASLDSKNAKYAAKGCAASIRNTISTLLIDGAANLEFKICQASDSCHISELSTLTPDSVINTNQTTSTGIVDESSGTYCMVTLRKLFMHWTEDLDTLTLTSCDKKCFECFDSSDTHAIYRGVCSSSDPSSSFGFPWTCKPGLNPCKKPTDTTCYPLLQQIRTRNKCQNVYNSNKRVYVPYGEKVYCKDECAVATVHHSANENFFIKSCASIVRNALAIYLGGMQYFIASVEFNTCAPDSPCSIEKFDQQTTAAPSSSLMMEANMESNTLYTNRWSKSAATVRINARNGMWPLSLSSLVLSLAFYF